MHRKAQTGLTITIIVLVLVAIGAYFFFSGSSTLSSSSNGALPAANGRAVFTITDAPADLSSVSAVNVDVSEVNVHSAAQGWITVTTQPKTYNLVELRGSGNAVVLADSNLSAGTYDQIRLIVSDVQVVDTNGTHTAKLPSGELRINGNMDVSTNQTASAAFDFMLNESLHVTGNGEYILAPVIQVETRDDSDVSLDSNAHVQIIGGTVKTRQKVGMNENGDIGVGLGIDRAANLSIGDDNRIHVSGLGAGASANTGLGINRGTGNTQSGLVVTANGTFGY